MYILVGKSLLVEINLFLSVKFTLVGELLLRKQPVMTRQEVKDFEDSVAAAESPWKHSAAPPLNGVW